MVFKSKSDFQRYFERESPCNKAEMETVNRLLRHGLLPLIRGDEVADFFGLSKTAVHDALRHPQEHYKVFHIRKKSGGRRRICASREFLGDLQRKLHTHIVAKLRVHPAAFGYVAGGGTRGCAQRHRGRRFLWNIDLQDFFSAVGAEKVKRVFTRAGYPEVAAGLLARLCTLDDKLPQGAPTSPALTNQVFLPLDKKLAKLCGKNRIVYTRYADDLSFSANKPIAPEFQDKVEAIVKEGGFEINPAKNRLMGPASQRTVVGLVVNSQVSVPRKKRREVRAQFHRFSQAPERFESHRAKLMALAKWMEKVHKKEGGRYVRLLRESEPTPKRVASGKKTGARRLAKAPQ